VRVRAIAARIARSSKVAPGNARWTFHGRAARVVAERAGSIIDATALGSALAVAAVNPASRVVVAPLRRLVAKVTASRLPPAIVIGRGRNWLRLYHVVAGRARLWRSFAVATGMAGHATPTGTFRIVVKERNPWWYPPASAWARGMAPIPPGPGNPLGTRWMGLSAPDVGIHGTPLPGSIGHAASHGCIRMRIRDAEWLFARVRIGSPVRIIGS
jgi:L,D-transpeptidase ErfK/SrfK